MLKSLHVFHLTLFILVILSTIIKGIQYNICQNETGKRSVLNCDNIYIWGNYYQKKRGNEKMRVAVKQEFTNIFNKTFTQTYNSYNLTILNEKGIRRRETVRVIVYNMLPYVIVNDDTNDVEGFLGILWQIIESSLNFKSTIKSIKNYDTGLEIIQRGDADIYLAAAVVRKGLENVTYSQPYFYNWYHLYLKSPEAKPTSTSYLKTLNESLWLASILMFCTLAISLWCVTRIINKYHHHHQLQQQEQKRFIYTERNVSIFSCFLTVASGFLNQGYDTHLKRNPSRIIIIFSLLFGFLLYAAMNAVLVAKLATFEVQLPFDSLDDLKTMGHSYSLCVRTDSFVYNNFTFKNRTLRPEWANIVNGVGCLDINEQENLAKILCKNNIIILENRVIMGSIVRNYNVTCQLTYLRNKYFENTNLFLLWNKFKWSKLVSIYFKNARSCGVMNRLSKKYIKTELLENYETIKAPQVSIQHVNGILFIYFVIVIISLLILSMEFLYKKYVNQYTMRTYVN